MIPNAGRFSRDGKLLLEPTSTRSASPEAQVSGYLKTAAPHFDKRILAATSGNLIVLVRVSITLHALHKEVVKHPMLSFF